MVLGIGDVGRVVNCLFLVCGRDVECSERAQLRVPRDFVDCVCRTRTAQVSGSRECGQPSRLRKSCQEPVREKKFASSYVQESSVK